MEAKEERVIGPNLFALGANRATVWGVTRPVPYKALTGECSRPKCKNPRAKGGRYCVECRRAYQKAWHRKRKATGLE